MTRHAVASGQRVYLIAPSRRDREDFLAAGKRSRSLHRNWVSTRFDNKMFDAYLTRARRNDHACFLIRQIHDDVIVGVININQIIRGFFHSGYLGYYGFRPFNGRGLMTEGMQLVQHHAFRKMKLHRLEANIQPGNLSSIKLVRRCGFRLEGLSPRYLKISGRWRDHERYAITIEDWRERASARREKLGNQS